MWEYFFFFFLFVGLRFSQNLIDIQMKSVEREIACRNNLENMLTTKLHFKHQQKIKNLRSLPPPLGKQNIFIKKNDYTLQ